MIWSDLYPRILPHVPGCPEPMVEDALRSIALQFCRDTHAWHEELQKVYLVNSINRYQMELPEGTEAISLASAIQRKTPARDGTVVWPTINVFGLLHFDPVPDPDDGPVEIRVVLQPSRTAEGLPDRIGYDYDTALIGGAVAQLQAIPSKDWSNPQMVAYHTATYDNGVAEARRRRATCNTDKPLRVTPHPFI